jgi:hypothetical protein
MLSPNGERVQQFDVVIVDQAGPRSSERWATLVKFLLEVEPKQ